jgi:predicted DNA-binding transcriptional regulator AlpA
MANKQDKIATPADLILSEHYLLKTVEVLKVLNVSRGTFEKLRMTSDFPKAITKVGNRPMWKKQEILEWLQNA